MAIGHQEIVRANNGFFIELRGTMNRDLFAKDIGFTDAKARRLIFVFEILRGFANYARGVKVVIRADFGVAGQMNMRPDFATGADADIRVNDRVWTDLAGWIYFGMSIDDRG